MLEGFKIEPQDSPLFPVPGQEFPVRGRNFAVAGSSGKGEGKGVKRVEIAAGMDAGRGPEGPNFENSLIISLLPGNFSMFRPLATGQRENARRRGPRGWFVCGIAGFLDEHLAAANDLAERVRAMSEAIAHRGPDDSDVWIDATAGIALGHRRL